LADRRIESADPEIRRIAAKYLESNYLPRTASLSDRVAELTRRTARRPSGQNATPITALVWPASVNSKSRVSAFHTRTSWSALASPCPSGLNATLVTCWPTL
jgi:hypothetical protein